MGPAWTSVPLIGVTAADPLVVTVPSLTFTLVVVGPLAGAPPAAVFVLKLTVPELTVPVGAALVLPPASPLLTVLLVPLTITLPPLIAPL